MANRSTADCLADLRKCDGLVEIDEPISAHLEAAEIQRRVYLRGGPAVLFSNVVDCKFPMVSNLFGTIERARYLFRDTLDSVRRAIELKIDPNAFWANPTRYWKAPWVGLTMMPKKVRRGIHDQRSIVLR